LKDRPFRRSSDRHCAGHDRPHDDGGAECDPTTRFASDMDFTRERMRRRPSEAARVEQLAKAS
jgi:hypothetical protein